MKEYLLAFRDLIFPRKCCVCYETLHGEEKHLCKRCLDDMPFSYYWSWRDNPAEKKLWGRTYIEKIIPLFLFARDNNYSNIVYSLKYRGNKAIGRYFGAMLGQYILEHIPEIDYIVPVPLHWARLRKRGYNQAKQIALGLASALKKELVCDVLKKKRNTKSQITLHSEAKWQNIAQAFVLKRTKRVLRWRESKEIIHVLLVDDLFTSGATLVACCEELRKIGNIKVSVATLAYVE